MYTLSKAKKLICKKFDKFKLKIVKVLNFITSENIKFYKKLKLII